MEKGKKSMAGRNSREKPPCPNQRKTEAGKNDLSLTLLALRKEKINKTALKQDIACFSLPLPQEELKDIRKMKVQCALGFCKLVVLYWYCGS